MCFGVGGSIGCLPLFPVTDFRGDVNYLQNPSALYECSYIWGPGFGVLGPLKVVNKLL